MDLNDGGTTNGVRTIRAIADKSQMSPSQAVTATYTFKAATPNPSTPGNTFNNDIANLGLSTSTSGASIHYTINGPTPTGLSPVYPGPFTVNTTTTVQSIAVRPNYQDSDVRTDTYTMKVAPPNFSRVSNTYPASLTVALSDATTGASVYYTTDETAPSAAFLLYTAHPYWRPMGWPHRCGPLRRSPATLTARR